MSDPLQALIDKRLSGTRGKLPEDTDAMSKLPTLWSFLTRTDAGGDFAKDPAHITIRMGLGQWLVELTDPTLEVGLTAVVSELREALTALEGLANNPAAPWRPWKGSAGKFKKKNKSSVADGRISG